MKKNIILSLMVLAMCSENLLAIVKVNTEKPNSVGINMSYSASEDESETTEKTPLKTGGGSWFKIISPSLEISLPKPTSVVVKYTSKKDSKAAAKEHRKKLHKQYNDAYNKPIKSMNEQELRAFADVCLALEYFDEAIKALEQLIVVTKNLVFAKEARIEIADMYFEQGAWKTSGDRYNEFAKLYPADKYTDYAQYKGILSLFYCLPTSDRDQKITEDVISMCEHLLKKDHPFKDDIMQIRNFCYRKLYEHNEDIFNQYCKRDSFDAAAKRLAHIRAKFDETQISDIELRTLKLDYTLACARKDNVSIPLLQNKLALYPDGADFVKLASNQSKKSYVNLF